MARRKNDNVQDQALDQQQRDAHASGEEQLSEDAEARIEQLQADLDEAVEARKRALADFRNFQRRSDENEQRARIDGAVSIVRALLPALDHFDMALEQDPEKVTTEQLRGGVSLVRDELGRALRAQGVERLEPAVGERFDPQRHEAMMRQEVEGQEPNTIVSVLQSGYVMGDRVLRPAKVAVVAEPDDAPPAPGDDDAGAEE